MTLGNMREQGVKRANESPRPLAAGAFAIYQACQMPV
jgi:hypothetical protein